MLPPPSVAAGLAAGPRRAAGRADALRVLRARSVAAKGTDRVRDGHDCLAGWLDDPEVAALATHVLVTGEESPRRTAERVVAIARRASG